MNKKKIGIIGLVAMLLLIVGIGFNSVFSKAKGKDIADKSKISTEALVSDSEDSKEDSKSDDELKDNDKSEVNNEESSEKEDSKDNKKEEENNLKEDDNDTSSNKNDNNSSNSNSNSNKNETTVENKPETTPSTPEPAKKTVTVSISCKTAINNNLNQEAGFTHLPSSGVILSNTTVEIEEGDTVFDVLVKATRKYGIHMEYTGSGSSIYIEGIKNLYEFDGGSGSGWMYSVNGVYPNYGAGAYKLKGNDVIRWNYTCNLGADLGASRN